MAEHINNQDLLGSGGHQWRWGEPVMVDKTLGTVAVRGASRYITHRGPRPATIAGKGGGPALLKAVGANRAAADAAMTDIEDAIEDLVLSGSVVAWEDDCGHSGDRLVLTRYRRSGPRIYSADSTRCWQRYVLEVMDLTGGFD